MANEELMRTLPSNVERVPVEGPFYVRNNGGSYTVISIPPEIITCGGSESRERAIELANILNEVCKSKTTEFSDRLRAKIDNEPS